jgi:hypothetical protein
VVVKLLNTKGSDNEDGSQRPLPPPRLTRRTALAGGLGITALIAVPDVLSGAPAYAEQAPGSGSLPGTTLPVSHFYLYGTTGPTTRSGVEERRAAVTGSAAGTPANLMTGLDLAPVKSPDGSALALVATSPAGSARTVTLTVVDTATGTASASGTLRIADASPAASILTKPVFAGAGTVALVIAISEPSVPKTLTKVLPDGRETTTAGHTWTTHHAVAYFDRASSGFAGPFPLRLGPNPYLALTDAAADATDLYLWAVQDYSRIRSGKGAANPSLTTEFFAVPLGSGTPRHTAASTGPWPSGAAARILPATGQVARVTAGRDLEVYSPSDGSLRAVPVAPLRQVSAAKPGAVTLENLPDGNTLITNSAFGRATVLNPAAGFATVSVVDHPKVPRPVQGAVVSADGTTLYTLGDRESGGLNAYSLANGALTASYSHGETYTGVYRLSTGTLLALTPGAQTGLSFFTPQLDLLTTAVTPVLVAAVY